MPTFQSRTSGILLHPTSLPGPYGVGDLGPAAFRFARFLADAGQSWWQFLPVGPPDRERSPYKALSAFAGNPLLIGLEPLEEEGLLDREDLAPPTGPPQGRATYRAAEAFKERRLRKAFGAFTRRSDPCALREFEAFCCANEFWLADHALFHAHREETGGAGWTEWTPDLRRRLGPALERARKELQEEIRYRQFQQFIFHRQWTALKRFCNARGIGLIGDVPFFVSHESADVWANPELFRLESDGRPSAIAGVPPDLFSDTGQRWGNPLYRWDILRNQDYRWWRERLRCALTRFDAIRLDHFIGFHRCWEIPADAETATEGKWVEGPGAGFFESVLPALGQPAIIAEDLGSATPEVYALRDRFGFPGFRILQFAVGADGGNPYHHPCNYPPNCVACTGTHDNNTLRGWREDCEAAGALLSPETGAPPAAGGEISQAMIRLVLDSRANVALIPLQDWLDLPAGARMNTPGAKGENWRWRLTEESFHADLTGRIRRMTETSGRAPRRGAGDLAHPSC